MNRRALWSVVVSVAGTVAALCVGVAGAPAGADPGALSISVVGNHFVNQGGQTIRLLGVNTPSPEYACQGPGAFGYGQPVADPIAAGSDAAAIAADRSTADAIAAWHANAVRVPLNEDCWLGVNGEPGYGTAAGYQAAIVDYVAALNQAGLYAILDLHWTDGSNVDETVTPTAPGIFDADGQRAAPDANSVPFWRSVATLFKTKPGVVLDLFNEPYSPASHGLGSDVLSFACLAHGGCTLPSSNQNHVPDASTPSFVNVGFQQLINTIRATGATQPIMLGGLKYSNDLSGWLGNEPTDPNHALAASFHNYYGEVNDTTASWDSMIAPIAAQVPVVTGEFDQGYDCQSGPTGPDALVNFDNTFMAWADTHGVGYTAWGWWILGGGSAPDPGTAKCSDVRWQGEGLTPDNIYALIGDDGLPETTDGYNLYAHLLTLAGVPVPGLRVAPSLMQDGRLGKPYSLKFTATGGKGTLTWSALSALPAGLKLATSGALSGTPTVAGDFSITVHVHDTEKPVKQGTATLTLHVAPMEIVSPALQNGVVGVAIKTATFKALGGKAAFKFTATGLPPGLKLSTTGALSGTPTGQGSYSITVGLTDSSKPVANTAHVSVLMTVDPVSILTTSLPAGTVKKAYTATIVLHGGKAPIKWTISSGALPAGLVLGASNGHLTGTPKAAGSFTFTVTATDASKPTANVVSETYTVVVT